MAVVAGVEQSSNGSVVTGTLGGTGGGTALRALPGAPVSVTLSGAWAGTVVIERSYDGGTTFVAISMPAPLSYTANVSIDVQNASQEIGVLYRVNCTAYTSGTVAYRLSH